MKTKLIIILAFLLVTGKMFAETHVPAGTINTNTTWSLSNSPYYVDGDIIIADGAVVGEYKTPTLTIEPGVQVVFTGYYKITVRGTLKAKGTAINKIVFRKGSADTEILPADTNGLSNLGSTNGAWHGIHWDNVGAGYAMWDNDSSIMEHCIFKYAKTISATWPEMCGGAVRSNWGDDYLRFSYCEFLSNYAVASGGALYNMGNLHVDNCTFKYNVAGDKGGALFLDTYNPVFNKCIFQYNTAKGNFDYTCGGGAIYSYGTNATIANSIIANNLAYGNAGAIKFDESNDYLANNIIANNKSLQSGTILINNSSPVFVNNTIANNEFKWASCITFWSFSATSFYNTILWNNKDEANNIAEIYMDKPTSIPTFSSCIIDEAKPVLDGVTWTNVIINDPLFVAPTVDNNVTTDALLANWRLQNTTPAINKGIENGSTKMMSGKDVYANSRRANGVIDIGATETHISKVTAARNITSTVYWTADTVLISTDSVIISISGKVIVAPGTKVVFTTQAPIINYGSIIAKGTESMPITFTKDIKDTTGFYNMNIENGGWSGIIMDNEWFGAKGTMTETSEFEYCNFMYAKNISSSNDHNGGAVTLVYFSNVSFKNCTFQNNVGIYGGAIYFTKYANATIDKCRFIGNKANYGGALATAISSNPRISNSLFTNNYASNSGGAIDLNQGKAVFYNNIISNNSAKADGGGVKGYNTASLFINNTIAYNEAEYGGGVHFYTGGGASFYNTLFWDNNARAASAGDQIIMNLSIVNFYNCNISKKNSTSGLFPDVGFAWYGDTANIFSSEPHFINPVTIGGNGLLANYGISDFSGCINMGASTVPGFSYSVEDYLGNNRINDNGIDIGAIENQGGKLAFNNQPQGKPLCINDSIILLVAVSDTSIYQWLKDGVVIPGAIKNKLALNKLNDDNSGSYQCKINNAYGDVYSNAAILQVKTPPSLLSQTNSTWVESGSNFTLNAAVNGSKPLSFVWKKNNVVMANDTLSKIDITDFAVSNEGVYICNISNLCGNINVNAVKLNLAPELMNVKGPSVCENDTFKMAIVFSDNATYQWYKDRVVISTAKSKSFQIPKPTINDIGNYSCRVSNPNGNVLLGPVLLNVKKKPLIEALGQISYVDASQKISLEAKAEGDEPIVYQWYKNGVILTGKSQKSLELSNIAKTDEALYKCRIGNVCDTITTNETQVIIAPQICMVGNLNQSNNKNVIIWDRNSVNTYDHYNVYRESSVKNKFLKIGIVPYADITTFADTAVNPKSQAFMYKITAVDKNGLETDINATAPHKTIHLLVTMGVPEGLQLDWDDYIGFDYGTYDIYRSVDNAAFTILYSMSSTSRTYTDFSAPNTKNLRYYVSVTRSAACSADKLTQKAGAGPFASAISNMEDNSRLKFAATGIADLQKGNISVYPNPFNQMATISYRLESNIQVEISLTDLSGRTVEKLVNSNQPAGEYSIQVGDKLNPGIYMLRVKLGDENRVIQMIKTK